MVPRMVMRILPCLMLGCFGCAGVWDTITSRSMRTRPWETTRKLLAPEDPVAVLTADPPRSGSDRASAMRRLKEPARQGGSAETQDAIVHILSQTATTDASPVLRLAAIEALGRFEDPRAASALIQAYKDAHGRPPGSGKPTPEVVPASTRAADRMLITDRLLLTGPSGFSPETVAAIRCRVLESLAQTQRPEAVNFLAFVATGGGDNPNPQTAEDFADRDVRLAAVRGLSRCRTPEAVVALTKVLAQEHGKDGALVGRSHDGLVKLTGKKLPPEPQPWQEVIQAGNIDLRPEGNWIQQAVRWLTP